MRTLTELNKQLFEIRQEVIGYIYELIGGKDYKLKYNLTVAIEDDYGSTHAEIGYVKLKDGTIYFGEDEYTDYYSGYNFGDFSTETIIDIYGELKWEMNTQKGE